MEFDFNEMLRNFCSHKEFGVYEGNPVAAFAIDYSNISSALHDNYEWDDIHDTMTASNICFSKIVDDYANYYGEFVKDFVTNFDDEPYTVYIVEFED